MEERVRILISLCGMGELDTESGEVVFPIVFFDLCCLFSANPVVAYKVVSRTRTDGIRD